VPPARYRIFASSKPTPLAAPVTIITLPSCEGRVLSVKTGAGGKTAENREILFDGAILYRAFEFSGFWQLVKEVSEFEKVDGEELTA
jgi:hypothetical protein